jgi:hypothetical protein
MCLILVRDPKVELDFEDIKHAVINNPDGWGYVIPDRGKLEVRRFFDPKGTDPEEVAHVLEDAIDHKVFLHLRFCTAGERSKENVHPFPALQQRKHGMQVWVMHNGTVSEYKNTKTNLSDTYHFTEQLITPLLQRVMAFTGKKACIKDPLVEAVIDKFSGWSKFVLIDSYGNHQIIGNGVQRPGYWMSNDYSFRPSYRKTDVATTTTYYGSNWGGAFNDNKPDKAESVVDVEYEEVADTTENPSITPASGQASSTEAPFNLEERVKFRELLGFKNLKELCTLSEPEILDLVNEFPEVMTVLIQDLLLALYNTPIEAIDNDS